MRDPRVWRWSLQQSPGGSPRAHLRGKGGREGSLRETYADTKHETKYLRQLHAEARHKLEGCQVQHELLFEWEQQHFWPQLWFEQKRREKMRCLLSSYSFQINHFKREIFLHLRFNADDCFSLFVGINPKVDVCNELCCETHAQHV